MAGNPQRGSDDRLGPGKVTWGSLGRKGPNIVLNHRSWFLNDSSSGGGDGYLSGTVRLATPHPQRAFRWYDG